jgi:hypothetical protein
VCVLCVVCCVLCVVCVCVCVCRARALSLSLSLFLSSSLSIYMCICLCLCVVVSAGIRILFWKKPRNPGTAAAVEKGKAKAKGLNDDPSTDTFDGSKPLQITVTLCYMNACMQKWKYWTFSPYLVVPTATIGFFVCARATQALRHASLLPYMLSLSFRIH